MIRCSTGARGSPSPECTTPGYSKRSVLAGLLLRGARVRNVLVPLSNKRGEAPSETYMLKRADSDGFGHFVFSEDQVYGIVLLDIDHQVRKSFLMQRSNRPRSDEAHMKGCRRHIFFARNTFFPENWSG